MQIRNVLHKGLRRFLERGDPSGLPQDYVEKIRNIVSFLAAMEHEDELRSVLTWKAHQLTGDRRGIWSLSVSRNWRITFWIDSSLAEIADLNFEDYH